MVAYDAREQAAHRQLNRSKKLFEDWCVIALGWREMRNDVANAKKAAARLARWQALLSRSKGKK
jgi:hypothetical protein